MISNNVKYAQKELGTAIEFDEKIARICPTTNTNDIY